MAVSGPLIVNLNIEDVLKDVSVMPERLKASLSKWASALAAETHARVVEQVSEKLHSRKDAYIDALSFSQVGPETWVVSLERKALWIEEGMEKQEMIDNLLKSTKTKTAKDGSRYLAVPFNHGGRGFGKNDRGPTRTTDAQKTLQNAIRQELKQRNIPWGKLEMGNDGKPKLGLLHSFGGPGANAVPDIATPLKTANGPGQGHGPIGAPRQGPTGIPFLNNIRVYQRVVSDKSGRTHVERHVMTFRMVSSKMKGTGRWVHPGLEGKKFLDEAYEWALREWETSVRQKVIDEVTRPTGTSP